VGVQSISVVRLSLEANIIRERSLFWKVIEALERVVAGTLLMLALPGLLFAAIVIMLLSRRSPLIAHRRIGHGGRDIWVLKLRTMWPSTRKECRFLPFIEQVAGEPAADVKREGDPRVTSRFAVFCRRYSIDEYPQLWQVIKGEMTLVGPRPLMAEEIETYYGHKSIEFLSVKPGLTGLWQVRGRSRLKHAQRTRLDLFMIHHWSLCLYLMILVATVPSVVTGKDAW
jgi:lipopolysaccharide/colanic/teichoic acid biosynthesis glycosyltransferase